MLNSQSLLRNRFILAALAIVVVTTVSSTTSNAWDRQDQALNLVAQPYSWGGISTTDSDGNTYQVVPFTGTLTTGNISVTAPDTDRWAVAKYNAAGEAVWVSIPANASLPINGIAADASGNVYLSGDYHVAVTAGPSTLPAPSGNDAWVGKMNSSGTMLWARQIGGTGSQWAPGVGVDGSGNVYVSGGFQNTTSFGAAGSLTSQGSNDLFLAKLNSSGTFQWVTSVGNTGDDNPGWMQSLVVDASGNSYVTGQIQGSVTVAGTTLTAVGSIDAFVGKVNSSGVWQWGKSGGSSNADNVYGVALDSSNNVYLSGRISANATFGGISATHIGSDDGFVAKLNSTGVFQWVRTFGGSNDEASAAMTVDSTGSPILVGYYNSTDFQVGGVSKSFDGEWDGFVAKWNTSGTFQWVKTMTGPKDDEFMGVGTDSSGNIYISGYLSGPGSVTVGSGAAISFAQGCTSDCAGALVWKLTSSGGTPPTSTTSTSVVSTTTSTTVPSSSTTASPVSTSVAPANSSTTVPSGQSGSTNKSASSSTTTPQNQTPVDTIPNDSVPTAVKQTPKAPEAIEVETGSLAAVINGKKVSTTVRREANRVILNVNDITVTISALGKDGKLIPLNGEGNLAFTGGDRINLVVKGVKADSSFNAWIFSEPQLLGTMSISGDGNAESTFDVPASIENGSHTLTFEATTKAGESADLRYGVKVGDASTGSSALSQVLIAIIVLAVLAAILLPAVIKRRRTALPA